MDFRKSPPATATPTPLAHHATQASNERGRTTRFAPATTAAGNDELTNMVNVLRKEIRELRAAQTMTPLVRSMIESVASPFVAHVLIDDNGESFRPPAMPLYDGSSDPLYHIHQYQTNMRMAGQSPSTKCQAFCLTLTGTAFEWI